jgi:clan AA aspartic protease
VNGFVDDAVRALIVVPVSATKDGARTYVTVWIDTAFNGTLVIPRNQIESLDLEKGTTAEAILADGQLVELETYACFFEWLGATYETQVVANDSGYPLLGTMLLNGHRVLIDYRQKTVAVTS